MTSWITICDTCKRDGWVEGGPTDGDQLHGKIEKLCDGPVRVRRHSCLMGCGRGCNLLIQSAGKIAYCLGGFAPTDSAAAAIVEWARLHAASDTGQVPYRQWPAEIKGHFVSRLPPLPDTEAEPG